MVDSPSLESYLSAIEWGMAKGAYRETQDLVRVALSHYPDSGEVALWEAIVTQALGDTAQAIALGERLLQHPQRSVRQDAKRFLAIWRAPQLRRSESWLVQIPDLSSPDAQAGRLVSPTKPATPAPAETPPPLASGSSYAVIWFLLGAVAVITCVGSLLGLAS